MRTINGFEKYRRLAGLTQTEVAEKLGIKQSTVSSWEIGTNYPTAQRLVQVAKLYGCTIENLFEGSNVKQELKRQIKQELAEKEKVEIEG